MRRYKIKSIALIMVLLFSVVLMQGCMKTENPNLQTYKEYVQSLMDINYHGEYELYEQVCGATNGEDIYKESINSTISELTSAFAIEESSISEENRAKLEAIVKSLYSKISYEVDEAVFDGDVYTVEVSLKPLDFLSNAADEFDLFIDDFNSRAVQGEFLELSEAEYEEMYTEGVIEVLERAVDESVSLSEVSHVVTILINDNGESYVSDDDFAKIADLIFPEA